MEALQHVMAEVDVEHFVDLVVDHSPVLGERGERGERGEQEEQEEQEEVFFVTLRDSLFSPVFFVEADAVIYLRYLRESLVEWREGLKICSAPLSLV